jgi:hypothetical protein
MNERLIAYTFNLADPVEGNSLGVLETYFMLPFGATLVYASGAPAADDAGTTFDLMDDTVACGPTALACAVAAVPGEWISTHCGGTETPVEIAAGSEMSIDVNGIAAGVTFAIVLLFLVGESWG